MKRLHRSLLIDREPGAVFALISDPERASEFFVGLTRWEPRSRRRRGLGARFKVLMRVGSIEAGGLVRITGWRPGELIEWESEAGITQRGRWAIRPATGGTELHLQIEFELEGPGSWLVESIAGRVVGRNMTATLLAVRRMLEFESRPARPPATAKAKAKAKAAR
ncbi:MAG TPA: SRPBCC family protein [Actinomycetota bacterium]